MAKGSYTTVGAPVIGVDHTAITVAGWTWRANVTAADTVSVDLVNNTAGTVNLASGTLSAVVKKF